MQDKILFKIQRKLIDLIPVWGLLDTYFRADNEIKKNEADFKKGLITEKQFNSFAIKKLIYFSGISSYNLLTAYSIHNMIS